MSAAVSVRVDGLTKRYGDFVAVDAISFAIEAGQIWGFLGPNGSGKSTTIRMLCGVLAPTSGRAEVLGIDVARAPDAVKQRIGYMPQGASLWSDLTVEEHLRLYAGLYGLGRADARAQIATWLERVGLDARRRELAGSLPGGFRKRLALACALLHRPAMIFLDEPTAGTDPNARREFWDIIVALADAGTTVMVTTHYLDEAEHCTDLALIYGGKIVASGSPEQLKSAPDTGTTVEIVTSDPARLLDVFDEAPFVLGASLTGSVMHVTVRERGDLDGLRAFLAAKGASPNEMPIVTPSLDDVFAVIVGARVRDGAAS